ncbi:conserved hypothetical protein [Streptomyces sp. SPB074]|nr:conserved hypothetical protein [Streptomyces sp. SPB074]
MLVRESGLNWSVLRFGFVCGEGDGHLESLPGLVASWKTHPAQAHSLVHHRAIAGAVRLALTGAMDGRTVDLVDEAPVTTCEAATLVGAGYPPSAEPLEDPWNGRADGGLPRSLGHVASVPTAHGAVREGLLRAAGAAREAARETVRADAASGPAGLRGRRSPAVPSPRRAEASRSPPTRRPPTAPPRPARSPWPRRSRGGRPPGGARGPPAPP